MDRLLAKCGREAKEVREELRRSVAAAIEILWPEESPTELGLKTFERATAMEKLLEQIAG
jgi:hypothetical protein